VATNVYHTTEAPFLKLYSSAVEKYIKNLQATVLLAKDVFLSFILLQESLREFDKNCFGPKPD